jgi:hypothetical protein
VTPSVSCKRRCVTSESPSDVTANPSARCTPRCTETGPEANADPLAAFVAGLSAEDRARLAALLTGNGEGGAR